MDEGTRICLTGGEKNRRNVGDEGQGRAQMAPRCSVWLVVPFTETRR